MRDFDRHPEPNSPDLGLRCLRAVVEDDRFDDRIRNQAVQLLMLAQKAGGDAQPVFRSKPRTE